MGRVRFRGRTTFRDRNVDLVPCHTWQNHSDRCGINIVMVPSKTCSWINIFC